MVQHLPTIALSGSNTATFAAGTNVTLSQAGGTITINSSGGASGLTVGSTTIASGTTTRILYDNAGTLGEYTLTGSGTVVAMATSPVFQTSINGAYLTASQILITDGSSNIVSAPVATYPSLTELSYLKGVTSAIQTQLNAKGAGTVTTVSVATANGFSGTVANATTTPAITIIAGAITPTSVNSVVISGSATPTLAVTGTTTVSGSNTGDQTLTIAGTTSPTIALSGSNTATFSAGTGITLGQSAGTITVTNSAPDKTVAFTGGTNVTIGGTYPNFSITDNSINSSVASLSSLTSVGTITTGGLGTGATLGGVTANYSGVAVGDILITTTSNVLTHLADVATGSVLVSGGTGTAPAYSTQPTVSGTVYTNNAITASGNAATVPVTSAVNTVTNNSAATLTITLTTSGAVNRQLTEVLILDSSAVAQSITWVNTENSSVAAPTTSNGSTTLPLCGSVPIQLCNE